jgi:hypothetical protein
MKESMAMAKTNKYLGFADFSFTDVKGSLKFSWIVTLFFTAVGYVLGMVALAFAVKGLDGGALLSGTLASTLLLTSLSAIVISFAVKSYRQVEKERIQTWAVSLQEFLKHNDFPVTVAAAENLIRNRKVTVSTKVYDYDYGTERLMPVTFTLVADSEYDNISVMISQKTTQEVDIY